MLNEGLTAARVLEHFDISPPANHPDVKKVGKVECLCIFLEQDGMPEDLQFLPKDETAELWKHAKGNHNSFPAIRLKKPLLSSSESRKLEKVPWDKLDARTKKGILLELDFSAVNPGCQDIHMSAWTKERLQPVLESDQRELTALRKLIQLFPAEDNREEFIGNLLMQIAAFIESISIEETPKEKTSSKDKDDKKKDELDFMKQLLVGKREKNGSWTSGCMTYFEVYDGETGTMVGVQKTAEALSALLQQSAALELDEERKIGISPLTGESVQLIEKKYPDPNLPIIGISYLYSKKSDVPCLERYGMTGLDAFAAGREEAEKISEALQYLTQNERHRKTWKGMGSVYRKEPQLLIAYLEDDPANDALLAELLSGPESEADGFDVLCGQVMGSMKDILNKKPDSKIELILLEKVDAGRRQVSYEDQISAQHFVDAMKDWSAALKNVPQIRFHIFEKNKMVTISPPKGLWPSEICEVLKFWYGKTAVKLKHSPVTLQELFSIYIPRDEGSWRWTELLERMLGYTLEQSGRLLQDLGGDNIRSFGKKPEKKSKRSVMDAHRAHQFILLLGILLQKMGIRKENYMNETAYSLGQLLYLADILHREYCVFMRNGGDREKALPSNLIGNEALLIAMEDPAEALVRLGERLKIYTGWAKRESSEKSGYARWALMNFELISRRISRDLPPTFTKAEQAQVLLGYLGGIPKAKDDPALSTDIDPEATLTNTSKEAEHE